MFEELRESLFGCGGVDKKESGGSGVRDSRGVCLTKTISDQGEELDGCSQKNQEVMEAL